MRAIDLQHLTDTELRERALLLEEKRNIQDRDVRYSIDRLQRVLEHQLRRIKNLKNLSPDDSRQEALSLVDGAEDMIARLNRAYSALIGIGSHYIELGRMIVDIEREREVRDGSNTYARQKAYRIRSSYGQTDRAG